MLYFTLVKFSLNKKETIILNQIGEVKNLTVIRSFEEGYILDGKPAEIFLHKNEAMNELVEGSEVEVFLYRDHQGRLTSTMKIPDIRPGHYGLGEVVKVLPDRGVFVKTGLTKDLFVGESDLPALKAVWPIEGDHLYCTMKLTNQGNLIGKLATEEVFDEIRKEADETAFNLDVEGVVVRTREVGSHIYTTEGLYGFVHESERGSEPRLGQKVYGRVIDVKVNGMINISFTPRAYEKKSADAEKIWAYLQERNGAMPYSDKSQAEDIYEKFGLSKAAFKRALGQLYRERRIFQSDGWTYDVRLKQPEDQEEK